MLSLMRIAIAISFGTSILASLSLPAHAADVTFRSALEAGATIEVRAIDGRIDVNVGHGSTTVLATATAQGGHAIDMHAVETHSIGAWIVCAVPLAQTSCDAGGSRGSSTTRIDFHILLPPGVKLSARDVSGDISVRNVASSIDAENVSGNISITTHGIAAARAVSGNVTLAADRSSGAKTVSGTIDVEVARLTAELSLESISGAVRLALPRRLDASIHARSLSGDITGSGGITFSGGSNPLGHDESATLGRGGEPIHIHTISGEITVAAV